MTNLACLKKISHLEAQAYLSYNSSMSLILTHREVEFGIGDKVRVFQKIREGGKDRNAMFEGIVIAIKNRGINKSFTVRKIGDLGIGIEKIFPLESPFLQEVKVTKKGTNGSNSAKLYSVRKQNPREIAEIYSRATRRNGQAK